MTTRMTKPELNKIDVHVGARLRQKRQLMGLSQERLGQQVGLTFQQIQKYERGTNRISASRLWQLAKLMGVPVGYFYDDFADMPPDTDPAAAAADRDAINTATALKRIGDARVRNSVRGLIGVLGEGAS